MAYETDVFTRQQLYLEAVKNDEATEQFDALETAALAALAALLAAWGYDNLGDMPATKLRALINEVNGTLQETFGDGMKTATKRLKVVADADADVTARIFDRLTTEEHKPTAATIAASAAALWVLLRKEIIPGVGTDIIDLLSTFFAGATRDIIRLLKQGYAEGWTVQRYLIELRGTPANGFRDGLFSRLRNQFTAALDTIIQHISSFIGELFGQLFFEFYQWISVLDSRTTEICRSRDGNVYQYGRGPRPPAHYRCRSRIQPLRANVPVVTPATFYAWLRTQPAAIQNFAIGRTQGQRLRSGDLTADDLPRFVANRRLTAQGYRDSADTLLN